MRKMRLDLDSLFVESFDTTAAPADAGGTVHGNAVTFQSYCSDGRTCIDTCDGTCDTDCGTCASECLSCESYCSCPTVCGSCAYTMCGMYESCGETLCGTCDPYCCCTCSCT
jgi:hypothetical protein